MDALAKNLQAEDKIATGNLIQSIKFPVKVFGTKYVATLSMDDYWKFVEEGVKGSESSVLAPKSPYQFKKKNIKEGVALNWIRDKGISVGDIGEGTRKKMKKVSKRLFITKPEVRKARKEIKSKSLESKRKSLAFLIGRNIAAKGIAPTHFASKVMTQTLIDNLRKDIAKAAKRDIVVELKSQLNLK